MEKFKLKKAIEKVGAHTGRPVDLTNRRDITLLEATIERHYADVVRKLALIEMAITSSGGEDSIYNSSVEYARRRHND